MESLFNKNGLIFWMEDEISVREDMVSRLVREVSNNLVEQNKGFGSRGLKHPL